MPISQAFRYNAGIIRFNKTPFFTGDGTTTTATLKDRHGNNIVSAKLKNVPAIYRQDWQGTLLLSTSSRTNLALNSSNPSLWTQSSVTPGTAITAPDGTAGAFEYAVPSTSNVIHYVRTTASVPASTQVTISFFAKAGGYTKVIPETTALGMTGGNRTFDLSAGSVGTGGGSAAIAAVPGQPGVYRCSVTFTTGAGPYTNAPGLFVQTYGAFAGDGVSGVYVWGMQVEVAGVATPYIATGSSAVTVTDYSLAGVSVTFGVAPLSGAIASWTGITYR